MTTIGRNSMNKKIATLHEYSACDVADALLKLQKVEEGETARAGFLADIVPFSTSGINFAQQSKVVGPVSTFQFVPKHDPLPEEALQEGHGIPEGTHWVDCAEPGTVVVIDQPEGQFCAAVGGIMAARMKYLGVKAAVVNGRVRDLAELRSSRLPVFARASSAVGTSAESQAGARNIPISVRGVTVAPGDIAVCDPLEGIVVIPRGQLDDVIELLPKLVAQDDRVKADVTRGMSVFQAFKKNRGNL